MKIPPLLAQASQCPRHPTTPRALAGAECGGCLPCPFSELQISPEAAGGVVRSASWQQLRTGSKWGCGIKIPGSSLLGSVEPGLPHTLTLGHDYVTPNPGFDIASCKISLAGFLMECSTKELPWELSVPLDSQMIASGVLPRSPSPSCIHNPAEALAWPWTDGANPAPTNLDIDFFRGSAFSQSGQRLR